MSSSSPNPTSVEKLLIAGPQHSVQQESAMAVLSSLIRTAANLAPRRLLSSTKVSTINNTVAMIQNKAQLIFWSLVN